jgi:hypothetical protein
MNNYSDRPDHKVHDPIINFEQMKDRIKVAFVKSWTKRRNSGNTCSHSVQFLLSSLPSKNAKFRICFDIIFPAVFLMGVWFGVSGNARLSRC